MEVGNPPRSIIVIFGAKVKDDGTPSGALIRRVEAALRESAQSPDDFFLVTGGVGTNGFSEAETMKGMLLSKGVAVDKIVVEGVSKDTLESIHRCKKLIREGGFNSIKVSSDRYHIPRCVWLFKLVGIRSKGIRVESGRSANGTPRWLYYHLREVAAIVWDTGGVCLTVGL